MGIISDALRDSLTNFGLQQDVFGTFFDNQQKQAGFFEQGLARNRQDRYESLYARRSDAGVDPLRSNLDIFRNSRDPNIARQALTEFTAQRQAVASASLFDGNTTGVSGFGPTATSAIRAGAGGLQAAFGLEQQNLAIGLSGVNNPGTSLGSLPRLNARGNVADSSNLAKAVRMLQDPVTGEQVPVNAANQVISPGVTSPSGNILTDDAGIPAPDSTAGARVPSGNAVVDLTKVSADTPVQDLAKSQSKLLADRDALEAELAAGGKKSMYGQIVPHSPAAKRAIDLKMQALDAQIDAVAKFQNYVLTEQASR